MDDPEIDRWIEALRRELNARAVECRLLDGDRGTVESVARASDSVALEGLHSADAPITVGGQVVGSISALDLPRRAWEERDRTAIERTADVVSLQIAHRLAAIETSRAREQVAAHSAVHDLIARAAPLSEVLTAIVESIERRDPSLIGCVVLLDPSTSTLHPGAGPSLPPDYLAAIDGVVIGPNVGSCGSAAWSGQLVIAQDIGEDPRWAPIREFAISMGLRHCWSMPIKAPGGIVLGTLALYGARPRRPLPEHVELLEDWARVAGIAIERHHDLERLVHDAHFDALTRLPNRRATFEALGEALYRAQPAEQTAVMFVDLDGLKGLNDTLGHDRADEILREVSERLAAAMREGDLVGRVGGDEFLVIAPGVTLASDAEQLAARLLESISRPLAGPESRVVTASIGVTLVPRHGVDAHEAIHQADSAMYAAKRSGRDRCVFHGQDRPARAGRRLLLGRELSGAERRGELTIAFQPVVEIAGERTVGVEALARWLHPTAGEISPAEFIPIAEESGAIVSLGAWVLRESCELIAGVIEQLQRPLELAVNVSAHQLAHHGFATWVAQTVAHAGLTPELLSLEIAESALAQTAPVSAAATARTLHELSDLGVRIVLDDFGSGLSTLSWLRDHPLGAIKLDRNLIAGIARDERNLAIAAAVIDLGRTLGAPVTAEGVETDAQLAALRRVGCERAQGFLFARPLAFESLVALLRDDARRAAA
ncbi:MAG: putative bifunctional diguanylate cyclase/phosphodiesterase [Solirubrobacteraceae bacterium]